MFQLEVHIKPGFRCICVCIQCTGKMSMNLHQGGNLIGTGHFCPANTVKNLSKPSQITAKLFFDAYFLVITNVKTK